MIKFDIKNKYDLYPSQLKKKKKTAPPQKKRPNSHNHEQILPNFKVNPWNKVSEKHYLHVYLDTVFQWNS